MRFHAFLPSWDTFAICRILLHTFLMRCHVFLPFWDALVRLYAFCWTIIVRDTLMRCIFCAHTQRSCQIRVTSMYYIKSIRMFEDDVTWLEHALVIEGGFLGVWVCGVMYVIWRMCAFFGLSQYSDPGFFRLLFLRVACECNRPSFSCDSVSICQCLQRWPQSVGRRESYLYGYK